MTPEEKARELVKKYWDTCNCTIAGTSTIFASIAKQCAIIACNEILDLDVYWDGTEEGKGTTGDEDFWKSVKAEIEKL